MAGKSEADKKRERRLLRLETAIVIFGWVHMAGKKAPDLAVDLDKVLSNGEMPGELKMIEVERMLGIGHVCSKPAGNERCYVQTRVDHRQFRDDFDSVQLVWSLV